MIPPILLAVPNVSEGRDADTIAAIGAAFANGATPLDASPGGATPDGRAPDAGAPEDAGVRVLDVHSDPDHNRSVFTIAGHPNALGDALLRGARVAVERIDVMGPAGAGAEEAGVHPHVGALDVAPIVYLDPSERGAACAQALVLGDRIAEELGVPVFLYGELSGTDPGSARTRAQLRRGGVAVLAARMAAAEQRMTPDFGAARMHPSAGATLVAARAPLVAFNLQLAPPASVEHARAIAALIREGGQYGLPGLRALGLALSGGIVQLSMNVERPHELTLASVIDAVRAHADIDSAELVGLAPASSFNDFPADVPIPGFDPARHLIENALRC
jgi:glutamate formiminotransferase/glutamate formiminotransferase/formiminotetrahydrofolate cyclodeaminase